MVILKSRETADIIKANGDILGRVHAEMAKAIKPGVKTIELDRIAETFIRDHGGIPSFKNYNGFPNTLCVSVNEVVVHGIPGKYTLKEGDIVSVDCGVYKNGYHADSAYTFLVGEVDAATKKLVKETKLSLYEGIQVVRPGNRIGDLGYTIQKFTESRGYGVVRELVGHGVGQNLHESPEVPNYGRSGTGTKIRAGMVLAIEPMITLGKRYVVQEKDGWTIRTEDRKPAAHFEHTVWVTDGGCELSTTFDYVEEALKEMNLEIL